MANEDQQGSNQGSPQRRRLPPTNFGSPGKIYDELGYECFLYIILGQTCEYLAFVRWRKRITANTVNDMSVFSCTWFMVVWQLGSYIKHVFCSVVYPLGYELYCVHHIVLRWTDICINYSKHLVPGGEKYFHLTYSMQLTSHTSVKTLFSRGLHWKFSLTNCDFTKSVVLWVL